MLTGMSDPSPRDIFWLNDMQHQTFKIDEDTILVNKLSTEMSLKL